MTTIKQPKTASEFLKLRTRIIKTFEIDEWWQETSPYLRCGEYISNKLTLEGDIPYNPSRRKLMFNPDFIYSSLILSRLVLVTAYESLPESEKLVLTLSDIDL